MERASKVSGLPLPRYETREAKSALATRLGLPDYQGRDWALDNADPDRIPAFCDLYESAALNEDELFALMALIVASLDNYLLQTPPLYRDSSLISKVEALLSRDFRLHAYTIESWCHETDEGDPDEVVWQSPRLDSEYQEEALDTPGWVFHVTPMMRQVWNRSAVSTRTMPESQSKDSFSA